MAGIPHGAKDWDEQHKAAVALLEDARLQCKASKKAFEHCQGAFQMLQCGFSHSGGTTKPGNTAEGGEGHILDSLRSKEPLQRIAGFGSGGSAGFAINLH